MGNWAIWYNNWSYRAENGLGIRYFERGPWYDYFGWFHKGHNP